VHSYPAADDSFGQILVAGDIVEHEKRNRKMRTSRNHAAFVREYASV
jgi:hypothetical protein